MSETQLEPLHYATYFDRHYLTRGLALYRSLIRHSPPFLLSVLCLDDQTYTTLSKLSPAHVDLIRLAELEEFDPALLAVKPTRRPVEYYWTCGPAFLLYLFRRQPQMELLTYLDADLFFFSDPTPIYGELGDGSILLIEHRCSGRKGTYNVGMLAFRRTADGLACVERWRRQCLEWCYDRVERTRFGDQMYLDEWPGRYAGTVVLRHKGAGLARWNDGAYRFSCERGRVFVDDDPLVFYHFSGLRRITPWLYDGGRRPRAPLRPVVRRHIYGPYLLELSAARALVGAAGCTAPSVDGALRGPHRLRLLLRAAWRGTLVAVPIPSAFRRADRPAPMAASSGAPQPTPSDQRGNRERAGQ